MGVAIADLPQKMPETLVRMLFWSLAWNKIDKSFRDWSKGIIMTVKLLAFSEGGAALLALILSCKQALDDAL